MTYLFLYLPNQIQQNQKGHKQACDPDGCAPKDYAHDCECMQKA